MESTYNQIHTLNATGNARVHVGNDVQGINKACLAALRATDPRLDKKRIEADNGGLLTDVYDWVLHTVEFQQWRKDQDCRLLWIRSDPGKGKTMLLCGMIDELEKLGDGDVAYFFCQTTDRRISNALAVLSGLLYMLVDSHPFLLPHVQKRYEVAGEQLFKDVNAWIALNEIFSDVLQDARLGHLYIIIDALDECETDLSKLLNLIVSNLTFPRIKWIVSSRDRPDIQEDLETAGPKILLSLEMNAQMVCSAVQAYVKTKVDNLAKKKTLDEATRNTVERYLLAGAKGTFLWVSMACEALGRVRRARVLNELHTYPSGLNRLYRRMMDQILQMENRDDVGICCRILAFAATAYRPLTKDEFAGFIDFTSFGTVEELVQICGSFLSIREGKVYMVHASAKEFLSIEVGTTIYPKGVHHIHFEMFQCSLKVLGKELKHDMHLYTDVLERLRYPCIYWVSHLWETFEHPESSTYNSSTWTLLQDFLVKAFLFWIEELGDLDDFYTALSTFAIVERLLLESSPHLHDSCEVIPVNNSTSQITLLQFIRDARRFISSNWPLICMKPLQVYMTALAFSPSSSAIKRLFQAQLPKWISVKQTMEDEWSSCIITLEEGSEVTAISVSPYDTRILSGTDNGAINEWDIDSGEQMSTFEGHSDRVFALRSSHDGEYLISASLEGTVKIWDGEHQTCVMTLVNAGNRFAVSPAVNVVAMALHDGIKIYDITTDKFMMLGGPETGIEMMVFSHNGDWLALGLSNNGIEMWSIRSRGCSKTFRGHCDSITLFIFSPDDQLIVSASSDSTVKIWNIATQECITTSKHSDVISDIKFSHCGFWFATASQDGSLSMWRASTGECIRTFPSCHLAIHQIAISHDNRLIASALDPTIQVWNTISGECVETLNGHHDKVSHVVFSHNDRFIVTGSKDSTVRIWDNSCSERITESQNHLSHVTAIAFSNSGSWIASRSDDMTVKLWRTRTVECTHTFKSNIKDATMLCISPDDKLIALASSEGSHDIEIWNVMKGECVRIHVCNGGRIARIAFSCDGQRILSVSGSGNYKIRLWDSTTAERITEIKNYFSHRPQVAFSGDGQLVAFASDVTIELWDITSRTCISRLRGHEDFVTGIALSHDGQYITSCSVIHEAIMWDIQEDGWMMLFEDAEQESQDEEVSDREEERSESEQNRSGRLPMEGTLGIGVAFSHDPLQIALIMDDGTIQICDAETGECNSVLKGHEWLTQTIAFSHDGRWLASGSDRDTVRIWDVTTGQCIETLESFTGRITGLAFSHDTRQLVSASEKFIELWQLESTGWKYLASLKGHYEWISRVVFSKNDQHIASASYDGTIKIWDIGNRECIMTLFGHEEPVIGVTFAHDDQQILSASNDNTIKIWDINTGDCIATLREGIHPESPYFDNTGKYVYADGRNFDLRDHISSSAGDSLFRPTKTFPDYGINDADDDEYWVTYKGDNILLLPREYKVNCFTTMESTIAIGCDTGRILILEFSDKERPSF